MISVSNGRSIGWLVNQSVNRSIQQQKDRVVRVTSNANEIKQRANKWMNEWIKRRSANEMWKLRVVSWWAVHVSGEKVWGERVRAWACVNGWMDAMKWVNACSETKQNWLSKQMKWATHQKWKETNKAANEFEDESKSLRSHSPAQERQPNCDAKAEANGGGWSNRSNECSSVAYAMLFARISQKAKPKIAKWMNGCRWHYMQWQCVKW